MPKIEGLSGREILDSRGKPTVLATCWLEGGVIATASVPSGASTGMAEAFELRDGDRGRFDGLGCRNAAGNISGELHRALAGKEFANQAQLDDSVVAIDGTANLSRIGANAVLAVSVAFARAHALYRQVPLYRHFADMLGISPGAMPRLTINLFSGGKHAGQQVAIQDVLLIPMSVRTVDEALASASAIYQAAADLVLKEYGMRLLTADEGGLAPPFKGVNEMFDLAIASIEQAGYVPGRDIFLGVDVAASHFYHNGKYHVGTDALNSAGMIEMISNWLELFPIISVEDGLAEDDWENWPALRKKIAGRALTLGDDLLCTNPARIRRALNAEACDALLLKPNQIGTLTEAIAAYKMARSANWSVTLSVRSGETEDNWAADLAVGWGANQFKNGSIRHSERLSKYNRLLEIAQETDWDLADWPHLP